MSLAQHEQEKVIENVLDWLGVHSYNASAVVQYLADIGFTLVPVTIIGAAGWTPSELSAYQAGIMHERFERAKG